ncbi:MAG: hypothetical protein QOJ65_2698 [Fimbriimonadaceae bacterium]|jgi:hypothetical protein|nr:hypothetical protein [Fimbriimonadaceae bacterium]
MQPSDFKGGFLYEQMPYEKAEATARFGSVIPRGSGWVRRKIKDHVILIRVWNDLYVQVLRGEENNPHLERARSLEPVPVDDDADWIVYPFPGEDETGYTITSGFAITYGSFECLNAVNPWLRPYGLDIIDAGDAVRGQAHFSELESGCFADAVLRLRWLESFCVRVNARVENVCCRMWGWLQSKSEIDTAQALFAGDQLIDPPKAFEQLARKTRSGVSWRAAK